MAQKFLSDIELTRGLKDSSGDLGTSGQILSSTGSGLNWISQGGSSVIYQDGFTGDGSTTAFTLSATIDNENKTQVYLDGVYQHKDTYSLNGTTLTFSTAPPSSSDIEVISFASVSTSVIDGSGTANDIVMWQDSDTLTDAPIAISGNNATFAGTISSGAITSSASVIAAGNSNSFGNTTIAALSATSGTFSASVTAAGNSNSFGSTTFAGNVALTGSGDKIISAISSDDDATLFLSGAGSGKDVHIVYGGDRDLFISKSSSATATSEGTPVLTLGSNSNATFAGNVQSKGELQMIGASGGASNRLKATYNSSSGVAEFGAHSTGGSTSLQIGTSNSGTYAAALTLANTGNATFAGDVTINGFFTSQGIDDNADSTAITINGNEEVGIGTTTPFYKLEVNGTFKASGNATFGGLITTTSTSGIKIDTTGNAILELDGASGSTEAIIFRHSGTEVSRISHSNSTNLVFSTGSSVTTALTLDGSNQSATFTNDVTIDNSSPEFYLTPDSAKYSWMIAAQENVDQHFEITPSTTVGGSTFNAPALKINGADNAATFAGDVTLDNSGSGDRTLTISTTTGGDPTIVFNSDAANRSGLIRYQDNGTNIGRIEYVHNGDRLAFQAGSATGETMSIKNTGVGIGTTSPATGYKLQVKRDTNVNIGFGLQNSGASLEAVNDAVNANIPFSLYGSKILLLNGNVGIGTSSPNMKLNIHHADQDGLRFNCADGLETFIDFGDASDNDIGRISYDHADNHMAFRANNAERMRITPDGGGSFAIIKAQQGTYNSIAALSLYGTNPNANGGSVVSRSTVFSQSDGTAFGANLIFKTNDTSNVEQEGMRITSAGNVGIGNTNPGAKLTVGSNAHGNATGIEVSAGSSGANIIARDGANNHNWFPYTDGNNYYSADNHTFRGGTNNTPNYMIINSSGNVGIGTTSPGTKLDINSGISSSSINAIQISQNTDGIIKPASAFGVAIQNGGQNTNAADLFISTASGGSLAERMRITSSGRVGIGTTTPDANTEMVQGNQTIPNLLLSNHSGGGSGYVFQRWQYIPNFTGYKLDLVQKVTSGVVRFAFDMSNNSVAYSNVLVLDRGNVGVGIETPTYGLDVRRSSGAQFYHEVTTEATANIRCRHEGAETTSDRATQISFRDDGDNDVGSIKSSGSATFYNTSSDYRLKQNEKDFNGLDLVDNIKVYDFEWKKDGGKDYGVFAHELQEIVPEAVSGEKDGEEMQGVDYSKLVPILLKSIQELKQEIEILKNK